tara:strand:+ start:348 stop:920 length:573 start_codon:yes stop_codon:yes gene_type:complete
MNLEERISHRSNLISSNKELFISCIEEISTILVEALKSGNKVMFCGNGGSAAESQHMAAEYCATLNHKNPRLGFAAMSLTVDTSFITAWTNDFGYSEVFSRQVQTLGSKGDVLICYTTSGTSENIFKASEEAKRKGIKVVLFTGENKELEIKKYCDATFHAPSSSTAYIQEMHTIIGHEVCLKVENDLKV